MAKYLVLWEVDTSRTPIDPKERGAAWGAMLDMDKQDIKDGFTKDWGSFLGENGGYMVYEGSEMELEKKLQRYVPFVTFKVYRVMSVEQIAELAKGLTEGAPARGFGAIRNENISPPMNLRNP